MAATKKAVPKKGSKKAPPPTWYFPTADPNIVIACDYNPDEGQYNRNCREVRLKDVPKPVSTAINKSRA